MTITLGELMNTTRKVIVNRVHERHIQTNQEQQSANGVSRGSCPTIQTTETDKAWRQGGDFALIVLPDVMPVQETRIGKPLHAIR